MNCLRNLVVATSLLGLASPATALFSTAFSAVTAVFAVSPGARETASALPPADPKPAPQPHPAPKPAPQPRPKGIASESTSLLA